MKPSQNFRFKWFLIILTLLYFGISSPAQEGLKRVGVVYIDSKGWDKTMSMTQLVRLELGKLNRYDVINEYDMNEVLKTNNLKEEECLSKDKILVAGKLLKADFMLSGSVEKFNSKILVMFREINAQSGATTRSITKDYPVIDQDIQTLVEVSLKEMYEIKITEANKQNLDQKDAIANAINTPDQEMVSIGGPRFGLAYFTGDAAEFLKSDKAHGGREGYPAMFQYGYQFEKMYLNEGNLQALVEFIPTLSGMDQGLMIPAFTLLNGFRSARGGWEFAFGPTITWTRVENGYMENGTWHREEEWKGTTNKPTMELGLDARGYLKLKPGLLIAVGKTFKSGKINMPFNFYVVPRQKSLQIGVSYGFNTMKTINKSN